MKTLTSLLLLSSLGFGATLSTEPTNSSLVVYNSNRALVHEARDLKLNRNDTLIVYDNVANSINTDSVNIKLPKGVTLYSQQYRYDQLSLRKMLDAHIAKEVTFKTDKDKTKKATLLSVEGSRALVKTKQNQIIPVKVENIIFKDIPKTLITKPSLVWNVKSSKNIKAPLELEYLISNISLTSNYILNIHKSAVDLSGWLSVNNRSGKAFHDTSLSFIAGDVNFVNKPQPVRYKTLAAAEMDTSVQHQSFEGYHHYNVPFKVDLANNEKTQIKFLSLENMKFHKEYVARLFNPLHLKGETKHDVIQHVVVQELNQPLPKGTVRVYSKLKGQSILLGESSISHTPKNTQIDLAIGKEFDIKVLQTLIERQERKHLLSAKIKYAVTNSSDKQKTVIIRVPFSKDKRAKVFSREKYSYTKGNFVTFTLTVQANTTKTFTAEFERKK
ncbi:DUF4139 domain-containing protein [Sulfurimonas marina]|uniref:DUF4139 domain-containing protein n=1 Tax=Sulfurimonas marina TaxID=2590551 RepID=A0A7M1AT34_9BACT|nr:hypothetical protein [Sulfurimonas marina]QOP40550.1 hypothetical protein FJR03_01850 [Sulfurimonas marina]